MHSSDKKADSDPPFLIEPPEYFNNINESLQAYFGRELFYIRNLDDGASLRHYGLISDQEKNFYVLSYQGEQYSDFLSFSKILSAAGINTPEILYTDAGKNIILQSFLPSEKKAIFYENYINTYIDQITHLIAIYQTIPLNNFNRSFYRDKFDHEWNDLILPVLVKWGREEEFNESIFPLMQKVFSMEELPGHRDMQSSNLFIINDEFHIIDYQDSMRLHPYYDIVSLIWDSYLNMSFEDRIAAARNITGALLGHFDADAFYIVSLQRKLHDIAAFLRAIRNGKTKFAEYLVYTLEMVNLFLDHFGISKIIENSWSINQM